MHARTLAIHGGFRGDAETGATAVPIHQTAAYAYETAQELAHVFAGNAMGHIYTRISNPTTMALERRLTDLEGGTGTIATSSGMAAISSLMIALLRPGDEILTAKGIFGGTISFFRNTLGRFGITTRYADNNNTDSFKEALNPRTKVIFVETIANPRMDVPNLTALSRLARKNGIPFVVDNTLTTPVLVQPGRLGGDIVVHSTSKYINGHGTAIGGALIDIGSYDWSQGVFPDLAVWARKAGQFALLAYLRNVVYRDLGGCAAPMNSFLMLNGLETLVPRMKLHCENARALAEYIEGRPEVAWVNYPGLSTSTSYKRVQAQFGGQGGGMLTFGLGTRAAAFAFIDALKLAKNMTHLGDAKTLVIHPASTLFREYEAEEREEMGVPEDMVRVSVGIEDFVDIRDDFAQAIEKAARAAA